jgi:putative oxidoreductase
MSATLASSPRLAPRFDLALTILRIVVGVIFVAHGYQKLFVFGLSGITSGFAGMGVPLAGIVAPLVAILECFGGLALILGIFTRIIALLLAIDMIGAILIVHLKNGFFLPTGFEFAFALLGASIALALGGAGAFSIEGSLAARRAVR